MVKLIVELDQSEIQLAISNYLHQKFPGYQVKTVKYRISENVPEAVVFFEPIKKSFDR